MISMLPIPLSCGRCKSAGLVGDRATTNMPVALRSTGQCDCTSSGPGCTPTHAILQWQLSPSAHTAWTHRKLQAQVRMLEMHWRLPKASQPANERCFVECRHDGSRAASPTFTSLLQRGVRTCPPLSNRQAWRCWINQSSRDFCFTTETPAIRGGCCRHYPRFLECGTKGTHSAPSLCVATHCHPAHYPDGSVRRHGTGTRRRQPTLRCRRFGRGADSPAMRGGCSLTCHRGQSTPPHQTRL